MSKLIPKWKAPNNICALTTTIEDGNIALHVGDNSLEVMKNRNLLKEELNLPTEPIWLQQTHSNICILVDENDNRVGDAAITRKKENCLAIMTADCLPITICNPEGTEIAAIHAGWKGLVNGIIENTIKQLHSNPQDLLAWIGPGICQNCFEIGLEVKNAYLERYPFTAETFKKNNGKIYANLAQMAELIFNNIGVAKVYQSEACTYELKDLFYSYRRQNETGRMATLIWFRD